MGEYGAKRERPYRGQKVVLYLQALSALVKIEHASIKNGQRYHRMERRKNI